MTNHLHDFVNLSGLFALIYRQGGNNGEPFNITKTPGGLSPDAHVGRRDYANSNASQQRVLEQTPIRLTRIALFSFNFSVRPPRV